MFLVHEYNTTGWAGHAGKHRTFKNTENLEEAVYAFCDGFERPNAKFARKAQRLQFAQDAWSRYAK